MRQPAKSQFSSSASLTAGKLRAAPVLPREFFNRDVVPVARELLGKLLIRRERRSLLAGRVVEVEAYLGEDDPAAHAYAGQTARNFVLFGPPGRAYVYFIYGNHYCLNVSCTPEGHGGGVLFRAIEPVFGLEAMARARGIELPESPRPDAVAPDHQRPGPHVRGARHHAPARQQQRPHLE